jgi:hypothetical protein
MKSIRTLQNKTFVKFDPENLEHFPASPTFSIAEKTRDAFGFHLIKEIFHALIVIVQSILRLIKELLEISNI